MGETLEDRSSGSPEYHPIMQYPGGAKPRAMMRVPIREDFVYSLPCLFSVLIDCAVERDAEGS